jgi:predicted N-acyltransferase
LMAACVVYLKDHSYGEYVFDRAWANAHEQHGLPYYPKALVAVPFTPVPGARLLAVDSAARLALLRALMAWCGQRQLSSLHLLFLSDEDQAACESAGLLMRQTIQFHWQQPDLPWHSFEDFLQSLTQDKRKKIRQERRKVLDAGVRFRWAKGSDISTLDWDFFYRCYAQTYREHGNPPYLSRAFFQRMAQDLAEHWLLFIAERSSLEDPDGFKPIACSLIALSAPDAQGRVNTAYGRYWGAVERVDCLHFEACYYQPLQWCIEHGVLRFEGGAQGEHKMARALLPVNTRSAHWLAHPAFADAVDRFLQRESAAVDAHLQDLQERSPLKRPALPDPV